MQSFLSKVFGRKKDDKGTSPTALAPGELLDGKFEAVSPNVSPSAPNFLELDQTTNGRDGGFVAKPKTRPTTSSKKLDTLPHLSLNFREPKEDGSSGFLFDESEVQALTDTVIGERRLNPLEALILIRACSQAITAHGLETLGIMHPHWYSASPDIQRKLISQFLHSLSIKNANDTPSPTAFELEINSTRSLHDVAAVLRWGLRHLKLDGGSFGTDAGWYKAFLDAEATAEYPPKSFSEKLAPTLPVAHLELLIATLQLFSSLAAHSEVNSTSGSKLSKLFGIWLLSARQVEDKDDWTSFYARWERTGRQLEHIFLARIRDENVDQRMPIRLLELVRKYPYTQGISSPMTDHQLLPRPQFTTMMYDALFVRIEIEFPTGSRKRKTKMHPLNLLADAFSTQVTTGEYADLWAKITAASKNGSNPSPLSNIFADETIRFLSIVPDSRKEQEAKSPAFSLLPVSPGSPSAKSFASVDADKPAPPLAGTSHKKFATEPITPVSPLAIGNDWAQFSSSGFLDSTPAIAPLVATLFDQDLEKTVPPDSTTLSRKSSKRVKAASRKSIDLSRSPPADVAYFPAVTEPPNEVKSVVKAAKLEIIQFDEAFIDFWSDSLLDPITAKWPTFIICKFKSTLAPKLTYGPTEEGQPQKRLNWLVLEQVYTSKPPPPPPVSLPTPDPTPMTSPIEPVRAVSPTPSARKRFNFWSMSRTTSSSSAGSQKGKKKEASGNVGEMGQLTEEESAEQIRNAYVAKSVDQKPNGQKAVAVEKSQETPAVIEARAAEDHGVAKDVAAAVATGAVATGVALAVLPNDKLIPEEEAKAEDVVPATESTEVTPTQEAPTAIEGQTAVPVVAVAVAEDKAAKVEETEVEDAVTAEEQTEAPLTQEAVRVVEEEKAPASLVAAVDDPVTVQEEVKVEEVAVAKEPAVVEPMQEATPAVEGVVIAEEEATVGEAVVAEEAAQEVAPGGEEDVFAEEVKGDEITVAEKPVEVKPTQEVVSAVEDVVAADEELKVEEVAITIGPTQEASPVMEGKFSAEEEVKVNGVAVVEESAKVAPTQEAIVAAEETVHLRAIVEDQAIDEEETKVEEAPGEEPVEVASTAVEEETAPAPVVEEEAVEPVVFAEQDIKAEDIIAAEASATIELAEEAAPGSEEGTALEEETKAGQVFATQNLAQSVAVPIAVEELSLNSVETNAEEVVVEGPVEVASTEQTTGTTPVVDEQASSCAVVEEEGDAEEEIKVEEAVSDEGPTTIEPTQEVISAVEEETSPVLLDVEVEDEVIAEQETKVEGAIAGEEHIAAEPAQEAVSAGKEETTVEQVAVEEPAGVEATQDVPAVAEEAIASASVDVVEDTVIEEQEPEEEAKLEEVAVVEEVADVQRIQEAILDVGEEASMPLVVAEEKIEGDDKRVNIEEEKEEESKSKDGGEEVEVEAIAPVPVEVAPTEEPAPGVESGVEAESLDSVPVPREEVEVEEVLVATETTEIAPAQETAEVEVDTKVEEAVTPTEGTKVVPAEQIFPISEHRALSPSPGVVVDDVAAAVKVEEFVSVDESAKVAHDDETLSPGEDNAASDIVIEESAVAEADAVELAPVDADEPTPIVEGEVIHSSVEQIPSKEYTVPEPEPTLAEAEVEDHEVAALNPVLAETLRHEVVASASEAALLAADDSLPTGAAVEEPAAVDTPAIAETPELIVGEETAQEVVSESSTIPTETVNADIALEEKLSPDTIETSDGSVEGISEVAHVVEETKEATSTPLPDDAAIADGNEETAATSSGTLGEVTSVDNVDAEDGFQQVEADPATPPGLEPTPYVEQADGPKEISAHEALVSSFEDEIAPAAIPTTEADASSSPDDIANSPVAKEETSFTPIDVVEMHSSSSSASVTALEAGSKTSEVDREVGEDAKELEKADLEASAGGIVDAGVTEKTTPEIRSAIAVDEPLSQESEELVTLAEPQDTVEPVLSTGTTPKTETTQLAPEVESYPEDGQTHIIEGSSEIEPDTEDSNSVQGAIEHEARVDSEASPVSQSIIDQTAPPLLSEDLVTTNRDAPENVIAAEPVAIVEHDAEAEISTEVIEDIAVAEGLTEPQPSPNLISSVPSIQPTSLPDDDAGKITHATEPSHVIEEAITQEPAKVEVVDREVKPAEEAIDVDDDDQGMAAANQIAVENATVAPSEPVDIPTPYAVDEEQLPVLANKSASIDAEDLSTVEPKTDVEPVAIVDSELQVATTNAMDASEMDQAPLFESDADVHEKSAPIDYMAEEPVTEIAENIAENVHETSQAALVDSEMEPVTNSAILESPATPSVKDLPHDTQGIYLVAEIEPAARAFTLDEETSEVLEPASDTSALSKVDVVVEQEIVPVPVTESANAENVVDESAVVAIAEDTHKPSVVEISPQAEVIVPLVIIPDEVMTAPVNEDNAMDEDQVPSEISKPETLEDVADQTNSLVIAKEDGAIAAKGVPSDVHGPENGGN